MKLEQIKPKIIEFIRSGHAAEMAVNLLGPWLIYSWTQPSLGRVHALMASAIPPIIWSAIQLIRKRRMDALSVVVLGGIALSLLAFFGGGGYRMLQLREHLVPAVMAFAFLGSAAMKRPLLVVLARSAAKRLPPEKAAKAERELKNAHKVRLVAHLNLGLGFILLLQVVIAVILIFILPVKEFLIVSPIVNYAVVGLLAACLLYLRPKLVAVFKEAEQDQHESSSSTAGSG